MNRQMGSLQKLARSVYAGRGCILMFHQVRDEPRPIPSNAGLDISRAKLASAIEQILALGYDIISLDEVLPRLTSKKKQKRFVVLTFDDGYKDNYTKALPVCERYNVPMTIYVTTCFPDRTIVLWWGLLETLLMQKEVLQFTWQGTDYLFNIQQIQDKHETFEILKKLILTTDIKQQPDLFELLFGNNGLDNESLCVQELLTWDEIALLHKHPLVTIGAHTQNHLSLAHLSAEDAWQEIEQGKVILEQRLNCTIDHFAYPFGTPAEAGMREFMLAKKVFKTAVTTRHGHLFKEHAGLMYALPRIAMCSAKEPNLNGYLSGVHALVRHKGKRVVSL